MPKWIYTPSLDNSARTLLGSEDAHPLVCVGINPSSAVPATWIERWQPSSESPKTVVFDGFMMLNVYPQRATNPSDMHIAVDPELHAWNMRSIAAFADGRTLNVWAAWGTLIRKRKYLPQLLTDIGALPELANVQWLGRGSRSKAGHPHHPLYARTDALLDAFHVSAYLATNPVATNRRSGFGQAMMDPRTTSDRRMKAQADALGSVGGPQ